MTIFFTCCFLLGALQQHLRPIDNTSYPHKIDGILDLKREIHNVALFKGKKP